MISRPHANRITSKNKITVLEHGISRLDTVGLDKDFPRDTPNMTVDKNTKQHFYIILTKLSEGDI